MNPTARTFGLLVVGGFAFYLLFFRELLGINYLIWGLGALALAHTVHPQLRKTAMGRFATGAYLLSFGLYFALETMLAFSASLGAQVLLVGACYAPAPRSVWAAGVAALHVGAWQGPTWLWYGARNAYAAFRKAPVLRHLHPAYVLPLVVVLPLGMLLSGASPLFADLAENVFVTALEWLAQLLHPELILRYGFWTALGALLLVPYVLKRKPIGLLLWERQQPDRLPPPAKGLTDADRLEGRAGILTLVCANLLLLVYNVVDVQWIWLDFYLPKGVPMAHLVHEGTYLLIVSVLFLMGCLLLLFRGRQHFGKDRRWLQRLSYVLLAQNAVMVASVAIRTFRYIDMYGLAYKRIGVLFFLALTVVGIATLVLKIHQARPLRYLLTANTLAATVLWLLAACVDWDGVILRHNLQCGYRSGFADFDVYFHTQLAEHQLPRLAGAYHAIYAAKNASQVSCNLRERLTHRIDRYSCRYEATSWLSWSPRRALTARRLAETAQQLGLETGLQPCPWQKSGGLPR